MMLRATALSAILFVIACGSGREPAAPANDPDPGPALEPALGELDTGPEPTIAQEPALDERDTGNALGDLLGLQCGECFGYGGLGFRRTGRGNPDAGPAGSGDRGAGYEREASASGRGTAGPVRVEPGAIEVRGGLSQEAIRRVLRCHLEEAKHCYESEAPRRPDFTGTVTIKFIVSTTGAVQMAAVETSTLGSRAVEDCLARTIRRWFFPKPKGGGIAVVSCAFVLGRPHRMSDPPSAIKRQDEDEARQPEVETGAAEAEWIYSEPAGVFFTKSEVTVRQWTACTAAGKCTAGGVEDNGFDAQCNLGHGDRGDHPVNCVYWQGANEVCEFLGGRLPTEDEWYAEASNGGTREWPWGNDPEVSCDRAVMDDGGSGCGRGSTWPVCSKPRGNSVSGLCDMSGNVREWMDRKDVCGGSWNNINPRSLRVAGRDRVSPVDERSAPESWTRQNGVRCARSPMEGDEKWAPPAPAPVVRPGPGQEISTIAGSRTVLETCQVRRPTYDGSSGTAYLALRGKDGGDLLFETNLEGVWDAVGFNEETGAYALVGAFQTGMALQYNDLEYLDEGTHRLRSSRAMSFSPRTHEVLFEANATVGGVPCRYVALIGAPTDPAGRFGVWVLDTTADALRFALPAPSPPPSEDCQVPAEDSFADPSVFKRIYATYNWEWDCVAFSSVRMDDGIIAIDDGVLKVSYGKDTHAARAKKRTKRSVDLRSLFPAPGGKKSRTVMKPVEWTP